VNLITGGEKMVLGKKLVTIVLVSLLVMSGMSLVFAEEESRPDYIPSYVWEESPYVEFSDLLMVDTSQFRKDPPWTIGFSNASISNSWRVCMVQHVKYEVAKHPEIENFYITDAEDDPAKQLSDTEDLLAKGIDLLIISPATEALRPAVDKAMRMGIPVVMLDRAVPSSNFVSFVESSNYLMGKMMAEWLVEKLNEKGNVIELSGIAGASPAEDRLRGANDVFDKYPAINVLAQAYCQWSPVLGKKTMAAYIARFGDKIDGVWSDSALQGSGAIEAFLDAGMAIPAVTGEDMNRYLKMWKEHGFDGVVVSFPVWQGQIAVQIAISVLNGIPVPRYVDTPRIVITKDDVDKYVRTDLPDGFFVDSRLPEEWIPFERVE
jgi:ribose transport system substrate-binding protein